MANEAIGSSENTLLASHRPAHGDYVDKFYVWAWA